MDFGAEDDAVQRRLVFPGGFVEFRMDSLFQDTVEKRVTRFKNISGLQRFQQCLAGLEDDVAIEKSLDVEVAVLVHALPESLGVVTDG